MLSIKLGVSLLGLKPELIIAIIIVNDLYAFYKVDCVVTSGGDGVHGVGSLHFSGNGIDFRTHDLDSTIKLKIVEEVKSALGENFDAILEFPNESNEHLHIEYQPKKGVNK